MAEIKVELNGMEALAILRGLEKMAYDYRRWAEESELRATECDLDDDTAGSKMASSRARSARDCEKSAKDAYRKLGKIFRDKGLVS